MPGSNDTKNSRATPAVRSHTVEVVSKPKSEDKAKVISSQGTSGGTSENGKSNFNKGIGGAGNLRVLEDNADNESDTDNGYERHETLSSFEDFNKTDALLTAAVGGAPMLHSRSVGNDSIGYDRLDSSRGDGSLRPVSTSTSPVGQQLFASSPPVPFQRHHSFYNQLQGSRLSLIDGVATQTSIDRMENLQEMRPFRLIGKSRPLDQWSKYVKSEDELKTIKNKKLREYYEKQNECLSAYRDIDRLLDSGIPVSMLRMYGDDIQAASLAGEEAETGALLFHHGEILGRAGRPNFHHQSQRQGVPGNIDVESTPLLGSDSVQDRGDTVMFAIIVNFIINFILLLGKMVVAVLTNSLSIVASLVDSLLDFLSTFIIWFSTRLVGQKDWRTKHLYPVGRSRLEPIGVLVFSVIMVVSFLKIANEAITALYKGHDSSVPIVSIGVPSAIIMTMTVVVKLGCWVWCKSVSSSAVQALAEDAKTDVIFNVFSMFFPILGYKTNTWWFDPLGALLLSVYVVVSWGSIALEHIENLTGSTASPQERQIVLYMCMRFADNIKYITALSAYHTGDRITVEVDLILSPDLNLRDSHDIGEALQYAIETLPFVERAFVHLDYRTGNFTGHLDR